MRLRYIGLAACLMLCSCSGGPSGDDIKSAMQEVSDAMLGTKMSATIEDVKDVKCKEADGKPGYICSFNATTFSKLMNNRSSQLVEARFVQNGSKWAVMNDK